jgi:hypothetical protein
MFKAKQLTHKHPSVFHDITDVMLVCVDAWKMETLCCSETLAGLSTYKPTWRHNSKSSNMRDGDDVIK